MALAGGRAILMELAHPAVAQAVADFDHFREDPARRARVTAMAFHHVLDGTAAQAEEVARRLRRVHACVNGPGYSAADPELVLWVHATFVDSLLHFGQRLHGPLPAAEVDQLYEHAVVVGELFGCPAELQPPTIGALRTYIADTGDGLRVSDVGRTLARAVFWPPVPRTRRPLIAAYRATSFGSLPDGLRVQYGYDWRPLTWGALRASRPVAPQIARTLDRLFYLVADNEGRGVRTALAVAGIGRPAR
jgi:uncharacterized protein (DUF2236 family)